jgi:uncharacterized protein
LKSKITNEKLEKYYNLTEKALGIVKKNIVKGKEKEGKEIIEMAGNYLSDSKHFWENKDFVNAYGALNYAHGWIDCGVRLGVFNVDDDKLFTVR